MKTYEIAEPKGIDSLKLVDRPTPKPKPTEVLIRVRATSLNYRDLVTVKGGAVTRGIRLPLVPLSDGAGDVVEVGSEVTRFKAGDRVVASFFQNWIAGSPRSSYFRSALGGAIDGTLAEYMTLSEEGLVPIPDYMTFEEAATLPCAAVTSWNALVSMGRITAGETVLVLGTGGVSIFALQFARMHGARVIATSSSDSKLSRLRELGASGVINYKKTPEWDTQVLEMTGGDGVDHVIEVGGSGTLTRSIRAVKLGGRISLIGLLAGGGQIDPMPMLLKSITLQGIFVGSREMFDEMNRAMAVNNIHPMIDRVFPFSQARDAYSYLESGAHFGKVCIAV
ncbi:MAG TPA: NAD(P)-dependent alcohol dehydrogenase [Candidatus Binataceae bacterium]|nr:NAD(P)-dependent alcohol dehydrogenase [Candidatus Binataceae bacterium]